MLTFHGRTDQDYSPPSSGGGGGGSSSSATRAAQSSRGVAGIASVRTPDSKHSATKARAKDDMALSTNADVEEDSPNSASSSFVSPAGGRHAGHKRGGSLGGLGMFSRIISLQSSPSSSSGVSESGIAGAHGLSPAPSADDLYAHVGTGPRETSSGPRFVSVDASTPSSAFAETTRVSESVASPSKSGSGLGVTSALKRITRKMI